MICDRFAVIVIPFPFTDRVASKRRPATALSGKSFNEAGHTVLAMITTKHHSPWPSDTPITDLATAGLREPCIVRMKLFTLDNRLIEKSIGKLGVADARNVEQSLGRCLEHLLPE